MMIRKILNNKVLYSQPSRSVVSAAFVITISGLASRALGLLRDRFLAATFGAGDTLDVYYAAFRIPDLIYNILIVGALSAAFIPVFTGLINKEEGDGNKEAWELANGVLSLSIIFIMAVSAVMAIFAPFIMKLITPGFPAEKMAQVVLFTRIMFLSPLFLGISGIFGGILTSFKRFLIYSIAPVLYNLGIIIGVLFLVKIFGPVGLAWGVVLGAFLHMMTQYPAVRHVGLEYVWSGLKAFRNVHVKKVLRLMLPRTMGIAVTQVNLLIITIFASTLAAGSLAIFNFAQNLQSVPLGVFGISFAIAVFPTLSALAARKEEDKFVETFSKTFRQILFFVIPLSVFILVLRAQLVRVILGSGKFDWDDTILTFQCLGVFVLSLFAQSIIPLLARSFYALHDTKTPFYVGLGTELVNIILVLALIGKYKIIGLAIAFSVASVVQMFFLLFILRTRFESLDDKNIIRSIIKIAVASFFGGVGIQLAKYVVALYADLDTFVGIFSQLLISGSVGAGVFVLLSHLSKSEEYLAFKESFIKRLFKGKGQITEDTTEVAGI